MYSPDPFRVDDARAMLDFIERHPLGALVAVASDEFIANHIPMIWRSNAGTPGVLQGHVAKANPLWQRLAADAPVLVIFQGAEHYISPTLYPQGAVALPTWNYSVVHVHGSIRFQHSVTEARSNVMALAEQFERGRSPSWAVSDAPADLVASLLSRIVPFEISISRIAGKFKANQQRPDQERELVAQSLQCEGVSPAQIAELIRSSENLP
jgi:transcriptional regulator